MSRDQLLKELSNVSVLIDARPWWQQNLLDEYSKSTSDTPRPVPAPSSSFRENVLSSSDNASASSDTDAGQ